MSNVRTLALPADLIYTACVAMDYRRGILEATGDKSDYGLKLAKIVGAIDAHMNEMDTIDSWTNDELLGAAHTMELFGGHFAKNIAGAFYVADSHNRERLISAFPDVFVKYGKGGAFYQEGN
jgi:hypothetical protein